MCLIMVTTLLPGLTARELDVTTTYRQVAPDWERFAQDLAAPPEGEGGVREALVEAFRAYAAANSLEADWSAMEEASLETLVHALSSGCPFTPMEKQALLEAPTLPERATALTALLEFGTAPGGEGQVQ